MTTAVLVSGGLDSAILTAQLLKTHRSIVPIYVRCGHKWEEGEFAWLRRFLKTVRNPGLKPLKVLRLETDDLYRNHWSLTGRNVPGAKSDDKKVYLPGKNLLLISKAAVFCALKKIHYLALAPLKTNPFPDARPSFFKSMEAVCSKGLNFKLRILTPFLNKSKQEVMKLGRNLPLDLTFSCLNPIIGTGSLCLSFPRKRESSRSPIKAFGDDTRPSQNRHRKYIHCGRCNKCAERKKAFYMAGLRDGTRYAK